MLQKIKYVESITRYDLDLIAEVKQKIVALREAQEKIDAIEQEVTQYKNKALKKRKDRSRQQKKKKELLSRISQKKELLQQATIELKGTHTRLAKLVETLQNRKGMVNYSLPDFAGKKGKLSWPVYGKIIKKFGRIKDKKSNIFLINNGIDIDVPFNAEVKSAHDGVVIFADRLAGYGRLLIIDHNNYYYTLYGHLSEFFVSLNSKVREGEVIGRVGREGIFTSKISLYFEIRYKGEPQNPHKWLKKSGSLQSSFSP